MWRINSILLVLTRIVMQQMYLTSIRDRILSEADEMQRRLPSHPSHPHGRIWIAHCYSVLKSVLGRPIKECSDTRYAEALEIVQYCMDNVEEMHICTPLYERYDEEPDPSESGNLSEFFCWPFTKSSLCLGMMTEHITLRFFAAKNHNSRSGGYSTKSLRSIVDTCEWTEDTAQVDWMFFAHRTYQTKDLEKLLK